MIPVRICVNLTGLWNVKVLKYMTWISIVASVAICVKYTQCQDHFP